VEGPRPAEGTGPTGALSNSADTNVKSCIWEAKPLAVLQVGNGLVVASSAEKVLGVKVDSKVSMGQQCTPVTARADWILSCRNRRRAHSRNQGRCLFLFTCRSLDHCKTTLSSYGPLHTVKTLIKRSEICRGQQYVWGLDHLPMKTG